jgi:DNA damage-binding protein 1
MHTAPRLGYSVRAAVGRSQEDYVYFQRVQQAISKVVHGVGGFSHAQWRCFCNERKQLASTEARNFLDGDLIEMFLDLKRDKMEEVAAQVSVHVDELCKRIEELTRLH